jgi:hypothetical protein
MRERLLWILLPAFGALALIATVVWPLAEEFGSRMALAASAATGTAEKGAALRRKLWRYCLTTNYFNLAQLGSRHSISIEQIFDLCRNEEDGFLVQLGPLPSADANAEMRRAQRGAMLDSLRDVLR